jgi:hypothetical protein
MRSTPITKPGQYGTLYLYEMSYTDPSDRVMFGVRQTRLFAYNEEHAVDKWVESEETGFELVAVKRAHKK